MTEDAQNITPSSKIVPYEPDGMVQLPAVAGFGSESSFTLLQRIAKMFAGSDLVPETYRGKIANCAIVVDMAKRLGCDPLMAIQNLHIIQGRPSWSSSFLIASVNACGRFTPLEFEFFGTPGQDDHGCRAYAKRSGIGSAQQKVLQGPLVTVAMAKAEGWWGKKGSKWPTMTELMLTYRAAAFWVRIFAPEISVGLLTAEEQNDILPVTRLTSAAVQRQTDQSPPAIAGHATASQTSAAVGPSVALEATCDTPTIAETASPVPSSPSAPPETSGEGTPSQTNAQEAAVVAENATTDSAEPADAAKHQTAYDAGRDAADAGIAREVPRALQYTSRAAQAAAWLEGYDYQRQQNRAGEAK